MFEEVWCKNVGRTNSNGSKDEWNHIWSIANSFSAANIRKNIILLVESVRVTQKVRQHLWRIWLDDVSGRFKEEQRWTW